MQRYFLSDENAKKSPLVIEGEDARHITKVMRMTNGDHIIIVVNSVPYEAVITSIVEKEVHVEIVGTSLPTNELPVHVTIACGLPKGDKLDLISQKSTELGVKKIITFPADRSIVKWETNKSAKKLERLQRIGKEAAEQSHRSQIPAISYVASLKDILKESDQYNHLFFAYEEFAKSSNRTSFAERLKSVYDKQSILVVFGPEGGISEQEASMLMNEGFHPIALGPRILRTETAPLYVLSAISYQFE